METIAAAVLHPGGEAGLLHDVVLSHRDGTIAALAPGSASPSPRRLVIPALVNAHDHARPTMSSFGAVAMPLESWILRSAVATPPDPYLVAASALARAAASGCGAMMIHYTRPSGTMDLVAEAREIARAAADVGLRVAFAPALRDQNPLVYGDAESWLASLPAGAAQVLRDTFVRPALPPRELVALTEAIAAATAGPLFDVQFGPAGVQWCSTALLEAVAEASARTGRRVHMHLLETIYQRRWADTAFPQGIVGYLRDIGLLSPRLTLAHCVHARPDELEMIAASGARIVTNFSSNLHIASGLAPIAAAHRCGCNIAVGVDGLALDEDDDLLREMRLVRLVHGGTGYDRTWSSRAFLALVLREGRAALGVPGAGDLTPGAPADFAALDLDRLDRDAIMPVDPLELLFARGNSRLVRDLVVAGRTVLRDGEVTGVAAAAIENELRARYRAALPRHAGLLDAWPSVADGLARWFGAFAGCG
jgi:cytosine/adenosine deaminase-related metal-dependent hydrolase